MNILMHVALSQTTYNYSQGVNTMAMMIICMPYRLPSTSVCSIDYTNMRQSRSSVQRSTSWIQSCLRLLDFSHSAHHERSAEAEA